MKANAFPKIQALGHREIREIFDTDVEITEKLDGSQLGFGKINDQLIIRSKRQIIVQGVLPVGEQKVDNLFQPAVDHILSVQDRLKDNTFYYAETLCKPKHNVLAYDRVPKNHIALFGYKTHDGYYCSVYNELCAAAYHLDVDKVKLLYYGKADADLVLKLLDTESELGGQKIEGCVVKNYIKNFKSMLAGKYVSDQFKERIGRKPNKTNKWEVFKESFRTEARWHKAVQHLKEQGLLFGEPRDIGVLIKETQRDIWEEELESIANWLVKHFGKEILNHSTRGLAEWYKEKLLKGEL